MSDPKNRLRCVPEGMPAVAPSQRIDWCSPKEVLVPCYRILGKEFGIDPCSNSSSIVRARHSLELPKGADLTDIVGGLLEPWHEYGTFYCNPPFGDGVLPLWVAKAIHEVGLGAEGIMLLPAYVSSYFFDDLWKHAQAICFWGKPGYANSRVKFRGASDSATFPVMLVYFGPHMKRAAVEFDIFGQVVPLEVVNSWITMVRGDVGIEIQDGDDTESLKDPIYDILRQSQSNRYDDIMVKCAAYSSSTLADIAVSEPSLLNELAEITLGEIVAGLGALQDARPPSREGVSRSRVTRTVRQKTSIDDRQLSIVPPPSPQDEERQDLDRRILSLLRSRDETGVLSTELRSLTESTPGRFRSSIKRLMERGLVIRSGRTTTTKYYSTRQ